MREILTKLLEENAKERAEKIALSMQMKYRKLRLSYGEVYELSKKIACLLEKNHVKKGDKVLLLTPNSPYWICIFWGVLLKGAILVPLNTQSTPSLIKKIAQQTKAKIIFKNLAFKEDLPEDLKVFDLELIKEYLKEIDNCHFKKADIEENDLAEIMYTSGTTGDPKGVMLTHKNLYSNLQSVSELVPVTKKDKFLSILPLSHIFEQTAGFLIPFKQGAEIIYAHSPALIQKLLKEHRITKMAAVPEFLNLLMNKIETNAKEKGKARHFKKMIESAERIPSKYIRRLLFHPIHKAFGGRLRMIASGGAPLDPELEKKWNAMGFNIYQGYGLTETSPVVSTNTPINHKVGTVGRILPDVNIKISADSEILIKGPNVFQGYFKNDEKTREAFTQNGWFKTDDLGIFDHDGFLRIMGRKKYMILGPGGQNVYPEDIEFELNKVSGIKDSCIVGLEKPNGRTEVHAVVLLDHETHHKIADLIVSANKHLASYQQIQGYSEWPQEDFPRSLTRKIKKEAVLKWLTEKTAALGKTHKATSPLIEVLSSVTGTETSKINKHSTMADLNLDSLLRVELVARIGVKFAVLLEESEIIASTTVTDLEDLIKAAKPIRERHFSDTAISIWAKPIRWLLQTGILLTLMRIPMKLRVEGRGNLKKLSGPVIFMPNHISYGDAIAFVMALPFRIRNKTTFAAAFDVLYEKFKWSAWLVQVMMNTFRFPRRESESIEYGLEYIGRRLDQGYSVAVFPEGKVSKKAKLLPLKRGAGLMAVEMNVPIIPVKITGTNDVMPYEKVMPRRRGPVTVKFGKPVKFSPLESYIGATEKIHEIMKYM